MTPDTEEGTPDTEESFRGEAYLAAAQAAADAGLWIENLDQFEGEVSSVERF